MEKYSIVSHYSPPKLNLWQFRALRPVGRLLLAQARQRIDLWLRRHRTRAQLARLPSYLRSDVGLDKAQVESEVGKPFWR